MESKKLDEVYEKMKSDINDKTNQGFVEVRNRIEKDDLDCYPFEKIPDGFNEMLKKNIPKQEKYYDKELNFIYDLE